MKWWRIHKKVHLFGTKIDLFDSNSRPLKLFPDFTDFILSHEYFYQKVKEVFYPLMLRKSFKLG
jgi:hypothetical protein